MILGQVDERIAVRPELQDLAHAETLAMMAVSADYLRLLAASPMMGQGFGREDMDPNGPPIALVTHGFWQRALGARPDVIGRAITLNGVAHTVVGIVPAAWRPPVGVRPDVILPLRMRPAWLASRAPHFLKATGRMRPGVSREQVRAEFKAMAAALAAEHPDTNAGWGAVVTPLREHVLGSTGRQLVVFMVSVGFVLLMACANLANLMLARVTGRSRELAVRAAVGASRGRLVRQLATESLLLAIAGGAVGVVLASGAIRALVASWPNLLPRMHEIGMDTSVWLFSATLSVVTGLFFGVVPALGITRRASLGQLRQGGRGVAGGVGSRQLRASLVVTQVSLAVVLLVGTGLLVRSLVALQAENPGFQTSHRLTVATPLPVKRYGADEKIRAFGDALVAAARRLPGVEAAALTTLVPMQGPDEMASVWVHGRASAPGDGEGDGSAMFIRVSPRYFETMAIRLTAGRAIAETDDETTPAVVVISESLATRVFRGGNPIGQRLRFDRDPASPLAEVIGVVADVRQYDRGRASTPQMYVPFRQQPAAGLHLVVKASIPAERLVPALRRTIADLDRDQPLTSIDTLDSLASNAVAIPRFRTLLMTAFGAMALLLAVMGLYGVMACTAAQRTKEIALRIALGATRGSVLRLVLRDGAVLLAGGVLAGLAAALALSRILQSMLFGIGARDPAIFTAVPLVLGAVAVLTMLVPAHRATRVNPAQTLAGAE
jgi:putative ABC transport system permease protein